jgi:hypothetical protein
MWRQNRTKYAILTVDTEALPKRASSNHVENLIWGRHPKGTAGIQEMCSIGDEFTVKHVFFLDMCGSYAYENEITDVIRYLDSSGQDIQLHAHPEYLPKEFWIEYNFKPRPFYMNQYTDDSRAKFVISHFRDKIVSLTGKPINAFRAGSFRWNAGTIRTLALTGIPLSFNNSVCAMRADQCIFSVPTNLPFEWSNGILEIPVTERLILPHLFNECWVRFGYPQSPFFKFKPWWGHLTFNIFSGTPNFAVLLMHSWSLLYWDKNGHGTYLNDARLEGYRKFLKKIALDYEVITTTELLSLYSNGKLALGPQVDLSLAELKKTSEGKS